jgi:inhibitor of cysteine peptidase
MLGGLAMSIVVLGVVAAGCSDSDDSSASVPVFHEGDTVSVENGQEFVIALTSNPSTGYSWQADDNPKVKYISSTQLNDSSQGIGSAGTQELKFKAVETGETTLELAYYRPFEAGVPPAETTSFDVTIK